ncbi:MAG TPA: hypothetical protein VMY88_07685 [Acidimicrobiales bacterium]|nr:hypothetical protein [Acidimicrobiales bacterium]
MAIGGAALVAAIVVAATVLLAVPAHTASASSGQQAETIGSLGEKVRRLQNQVITLQLQVSALRTGLPAQSLSPQETYRRIQALDGRLSNVCSRRQVVTSIFQSSSGQVTASYVNC